MIFSYLLNMQSHPSWVCGLKHNNSFWLQAIHRSHPSWVCGLKLDAHSSINAFSCHTLRGCVDWNRDIANDGDSEKLSHPSWVCGLKQSLGQRDLHRLPVTPFVGVWIETWNGWGFVNWTRVTPFVGVWIETWMPHCSTPSKLVTPFVGVWIETLTRK